MGANLTCATLCDTNGESPSLKPRLGDIPESCLALVLMHLDPPDICKLARLNRAFRGASSADFIWESKLPSNYKFICEKVLDEKSVVGLEKKDVYARMCRPYPFDGGAKVRVCLSLNPVLVLFRIRLDGLAFYRRYGWIRILVGFVFQFLPRGWLLLGLMTGDIGIKFQLKNQGDIYFHTKQINFRYFHWIVRSNGTQIKYCLVKNFRESSLFWWFGMVSSVQANFRFLDFIWIICHSFLNALINMIASLYI